ncbi:MAG TPA: hypothetical protein VMQ81_02660, partial [Acidimicrobiia bacterium]|nr:hypothetical protein [Acidimicrobiia bacterium]
GAKRAETGVPFMTTTLDRPEVDQTQTKSEPARQPGTAPPGQMTVGKYMRWVLAAISLGAGGIHFAMISPHWDEYWVEGAFFAALAWFQLGWAAGVVLRPSRLLYAAGGLVSAGAIAAWAVSRTSGIPFGPHSGVAEEASFVDILAQGFMGVILLGCLALLLRPALEGTVARRFMSLPAGIAGLGVVALSTMAFTPSFASGHSHGPPGHPAGGHGGDEAGAVASGHPHDEQAAGHASGATNVVVTADGTSACEEAGVANEGNSGHGHRGPVPFTPMDPATRDLNAQQVAASNAFVAAHPTAVELKASGYRSITPYVPCIAQHWIKGGALANPFDPAEPEIALTTGGEDDATNKIVGLSYLQFADPDEAPEGFAGANDPWHVHEKLCIGKGGVVGDESTTEEECAERGGTLRKLGNLWMNHMWNVPGWESRWGLFSSEHPDLGGTIGNINATPEEVEKDKKERAEEEN